MSNNQIKVMLLSRESKNKNSIWSNQCPNNELKWNNCTFITNPYDSDYDWFVVRNDVPYIFKNKIKLNCDTQRTILFTSEPSSITRYGKKFVNQFGFLLSSQEKEILPHTNAIRSPTGNVWHYGKSYDQLRNEKPIIKNKIISTVCSTKQMKHTKHAERLKFTKNLKKDLSCLDLYGKGHNYIKNKYDAIDPYKYHLVIENHKSKYHFTEKITDAFLGYSIPIYYGCTNINDYFPINSYIEIDINNYEESLNIIKNIINDPDEYKKRLDAVIEARRRVLEIYNLPAMIADIIEKSELEGIKLLNKKIIYSRRIMRLKNPNDFISFAFWRMKNLLK